MNFNHWKNSFNSDGVFIDISRLSCGIDCRDMYMLWHGSIVYDCIIIHLCKWHECIDCDEGQCFPGPKFITMPNSPSDDSHCINLRVSFFILNNLFSLFGGLCKISSERKKKKEINGIILIFCKAWEGNYSVSIDVILIWFGL